MISDLRSHLRRLLQGIGFVSRKSQRQSKLLKQPTSRADDANSATDAPAIETKSTKSTELKHKSHVKYHLQQEQNEGFECKFVL